MVKEEKREGDRVRKERGRMKAVRDDKAMKSEQAPSHGKALMMRARLDGALD